MKKAFLILCLITPHLLSAQSNRVKWTDDVKITWDDFQGVPDVRTNLKAMTNSGIGYEIQCVNGELEFNVWTYFNKNMSWVKDGARSERLLEHERLHFDITELYTRKFIQQVRQLNDPCGRDVEKIQHMYEDNMNDYNAFQNRYDRETKHSIDQEAQKEWNERVQNQLKQLEMFSSEFFW